MNDVLDVTDCKEIGCFLMSKGRAEKAEPFFVRALELDSQSTDALTSMAAALMAQGRIEEAREKLNTAISIDPTYAAAWFNLGTLQHREGLLAEARMCLLVALRQNPPFMDTVWMGLAMNSQYCCDWEKAISEYECALELAPDNAAARMSLGIIQMLLGRWDVGLKNYEARLSVHKVGYPTTVFPIWSDIAK